MSSLGRYIKERREALSAQHAGYSIRSVAKRIGIHHSYLSKLERGENAPLTEERIHALARLLGEDPETLLALSGKLSERTTSLIKTNLSTFHQFLLDLEKQAPASMNAPDQRLAQRKNELEELTRLLRDEILQRQVLESQLREQQKVQTTILENLRDVSVVLLDPQFRVLWSNTPVTENPSGLLSRNGAGLCDTTDQDGFETNPFCPSWRALMTRTTQNGTYRAHDGRHWLLRSAPVLNAEKAVVQVVHLQFEVTELIKARQALEASEERWKFALEGSQSAVWDYDVPSGKVQCSPRWMAMLGYVGNEFELTLDQWRRLLHPADRDHAMDMLQAHLRGETEFYDFEYRLLCKDDSYKWIHSRGKLMERSTTGKPLRITGTHHDMSERKAFEEQILANEAFLESLLGSIEEGITVLAPDMTVRYANQTMTRWYAEGISALGKKCHQAFHQMSECCSRCPAVRSLRSGRNEFEVIEITSATKVRSIEFSAYPIRETPGDGMTGVIVFVRDITSKIKRPSEKSDALSMFRDMFESAPVGICSVDAAGRYISMNATYARLHGFSSPKEMMRVVQSESETFFSPAEQADLQQQLQGGDTLHGFLCRIRRKDGTTLWTTRSIRTVRNNCNEMMYVNVFVDMIHAPETLGILQQELEQ